jgi:hypothetical protein
VFSGDFEIVLVLVVVLVLEMDGGSGALLQTSAWRGAALACILPPSQVSPHH